MTDTENTNDDKQVSQKAEAYEKFTKMKNAGVIHTPMWKELKTQRIELVADEDSRKIHVKDAIVKLIGDEPYNGGFESPLFVRACPLHPRPGVLESSQAFSVNETIETVSRITEQMLGPDPSPTPQFEHGLCDPDGCIIVQPFVEASASAVVSPNAHVTIGEGHDGVTAATPDGLQIVLNLKNRTDGQAFGALEKMGIDPAKIQLEFVNSTKHRPYDPHSSRTSEVGMTRITQLRGCPEGHMDIAPPPKGFTINGQLVGGKVEVTQVITLTDGGDDEMALLEQTLRELDDITGVVVAHPSGSPSAHHTGQCLGWGVSYIISDKPQVGDTWVEVNGWVIDDPTIEPQPFEAYDYRHAFERGLQVGLYKFARQYGWLSNHFHQLLGGQVMKDPRMTAYFAGVFAGYLPNAIRSVSMGEMRHAHSQKKNTTPLDMATFFATNVGLPHNQLWTTQRRHYYALIEEQPIDLISMEGQLMWLERQYRTGWNGSYGGTKYAESTEKGLNVVVAIGNYMAKKTKANFKTLLSLVNEAENIVHNNGFFLNKFLSKRAFDVGTDWCPKQNKTFLTSFHPEDFFNIFYAAKHAHQYYEADTLPQPNHATDHITTYALTNDNYHQLKNKPLFSRTDLPSTYLEIADNDELLAYIHAGHSMYTCHEDKFIPCGLDACPMCINKNVQAINNTLNIPLPTSNDYDMYAPTNLKDIEIPDFDYDLVIALFKSSVYEETTMPTVAKFVVLVNNNGLFNSSNATVVKAIKHYAHFITNAPLEYKNPLTQMVTQMVDTGEE